jgi:ElaB/YqjD/DUF883 family membrane-anchored ribosome-binding protein
MTLDSTTKAQETGGKTTSGVHDISDSIKSGNSSGLRTQSPETPSSTEPSKNDKERRPQELSGAGDSQLQSAQEKVSEASSKAGSAAQDTWQAAKDKAQSRKEASKDYANAGKEKMGEMKTKAQESTQKTWDTSKDKAQEVKESTGGYMESAKQKIVDTKDSTVQKVTDIKDSTVNTVSDFGSKVQESAGNAWNTVKTTWTGTNMPDPVVSKEVIKSEATAMPTKHSEEARVGSTQMAVPEYSPATDPTTSSENIQQKTAQSFRSSS